MDTRPDSEIVLLAGEFTGSVARAVIGRLLGEMSGIRVDALADVLMGVTVIVAIGLDDGAPVSHAGDVRASLWSGCMFDSGMSVVVMIKALIDVLACDAIGAVPDIGILAVADIKVWPTTVAVLACAISSSSSEKLLSLRCCSITVLGCRASQA